ncbi:MAG: hypothetical protein E7295_13725 [Lachnospiraceae bacterium]|nr:hypothetical protein [Lachnospiraceae bacterium]
MKNTRLPEEFSFPPKEDGPLIEPKGLPTESAPATEFSKVAEPSMDMHKEFEGKSGGEESEKAKEHRLIKRMLLMPIAATTATLAIVFSSFGYDPLGEDFLNQEWRIDGPNEEGQDGQQGKGEADPQGHGEEKNVRDQGVAGYPGDLTGVIIDVTYVPTGESYRPAVSGEEGLEVAREWVKMQGGDPDTITYVKSEQISTGPQYSDDLGYVGDADDPANWYVFSGEVTEGYQEIAYFNAYASKETQGQEPDESQLESFPILVMFVPTGEKFYPQETGERGIEEAREWIRSIGGNPDSMEFVSFKRDKKYELDDGVLSQIIMDFAYYEVYEYAEGVSENGDVFPVLSNLDPDFAGNYSGDIYGSEYFIRIKETQNSDFVYLKAGEAWRGTYDDAVETTVDGAWYDEATNTLTLSNFEASMLDVNLMGNGFTIRLIGNNYIDLLQVWGFRYGGSLTLTGEGSLVVNDHYARSDGGLIMVAEGSETCLMIENGVTLECYGNPAFIIYQTTMEDAVYYGSDIELSGGTEAAGGWNDEAFGYNVQNYTILGGDDQPASYVHFAPKE